MAYSTALAALRPATATRFVAATIVNELTIRQVVEVAAEDRGMQE